MLSRKTIAEKLLIREEHKPSTILYRLLMIVVRILNKKIHTTFTYNAYPGKDDGPIVLVSNHASRMDYLFTAPVALPKKLNYVVGYNEFFRFPTNILLNIMQVIPKKNFTPDVHCIRSIKRVISKGGSICIMPEGMSSITGMAQPVMSGIGKLLKSLKVNVYYTKVSGGYLTYTKHCLDERVGRCEVVVDKMFSAEDFDSLTEEQIEDSMNRLLAHDDYIWNSSAKVHFKGKGQMAKNLGDLLYMCPKCGAMYRMQSDGNQMRCTCCGNTVQVDESYTLTPVGEGSICPEHITDWTIMEREHAALQVREEDFCHKGHVRLGILPDHWPLMGSNTSNICGEGDLMLTKDGLSFSGTLKNEPMDFSIPIQSLPTYGMCTDITRFYTFLDGTFMEFYPDKKDVLRWDHLTEEMHRFCGGKWQNTEYRHI